MEGVSERRPALSRMRQALPTVTDVFCGEWLASDRRAGLGVLQAAWKGRNGHFVRSDEGPVCAFDGMLVGQGEGVQAEGATPTYGAGHLVEAYLRWGVECFSRFNGSFNAAIWDPRSARLILANDKVGHRPMFYASHGKELLFGSYAARVLAAAPQRAVINLGGLVDLINFGFVTNDATLFEGVRLLPPGSVLVFEAGRLEVNQYWSYAAIEPVGRLDDKRVAEAAEVLKQAVVRSVTSAPKVALSLTGGADSRALLAAAVTSELEFVTHSGGHVDSTDVVVARQLSETLGIPHVFEPVGPERIADWLYPQVLYQGGLIATLHSHPCQTIDYPLPFDAMVQGIGGEFARAADWISPARLPDHRFDAQILRQKLETSDARRLRLQKVNLWRSSYREVAREQENAHLDAIVQKYRPADHPLAALKFISLHDLCRADLNKALMIVRARREVYCPYFDHDWVQAMASIPLEERVRKNLQIEIVRHLTPRLLRPLYTHTMLPMNASRLRVHWGNRVRHLSSRLARSTRIRLHREAIPNTNFPAWVRNEMLPATKGLLEAPDAAFRQYLNGAAIRQLVDEHHYGRRRWMALVAALTVFEIAHKYWVEGDHDALTRGREAFVSRGKIHYLGEQGDHANPTAALPPQAAVANGCPYSGAN